MKKIGLALGGGGARGLAHLGVLRVLEREKIRISYIAGTSMGAIIGACYAINPDIAVVDRQIRKVLASSVFAHMKIEKLSDDSDKENKSLFRKAQEFIKEGYYLIVENTQYALLSLEKLEQVINMLLPDIDISQTKISFACVSTDLTNGKGTVFSKGSLRRCVTASSSIPGIFPPVNIDGIYYNDGGAISITPVDEVKAMGADIVIAANVKSKIMHWEKPEKAREIMSRSNYITGVLLNEIHLKRADIVISPEVRHLHWTDFDKIDFIVKKGEAATSRKILEIKAKTSYYTLINKMRKLFRFGSARQAPQ